MKHGVVNLGRFRSHILDLATKIGETYVAVYAESSNTEYLTFQAYINNVGITNEEHLSMESCIAEMTAMVKAYAAVPKTEIKEELPL